MMTDLSGTPVVDPFHVWLGLDVNEKAIPASLKSIDQWVLWRAERKPDGVGVAKVPYQENGLKASSTNPATWTDFASAIGSLYEEGSALSGIGFVVRSDNGILVLDFDHVRNAHTGAIDATVSGVVDYLGTYAEISPSGTGIRIVGYGTRDGAITSKVLQGWSTGRYVTITGHRLENSPADLAAIDPDKLAEVVAWFADAPAKGAGRADPNARTGYQLDTRQVLEIRSALGYIDPDESYDIWIRIGMALRSTGADNAFGLWNEWSQIGPKYNAGIMRPKWHSFDGKEHGVMLPTLFALAQERGWVNPATREAIAFEQATGMSFEEANRQAPDLETIADVRKNLAPFPVDSLNDIAAWIESTAAVSYPVATHQAVLSLVSLAASRLYTTPQGDPLSVYLGVSARSIGELRYVHHAVSQIVNAAGLRRMVRATRLTSPAAIYKTLLRSPAAIYLSDDYGGVAAFAKRQPSGLQEHALSLLATVYDGKPIQLDGPEDAGFKSGAGQVSDEQPIIYAPSLSLLALISVDHLSTLMRASESGRGALQQLLLAIEDDRSSVERDPQDLDPPAWIGTQLRRIRRVPHPEVGVDLNLADIFSNVTADMRPRQAVVPFQCALDPVYATLDAISSDRRVRSLLLAARSHVRRIAAGIAVWENADSPVVSNAILEWSGEYVAGRMAEMVERFEVLQNGDGKLTPYSQVLMKLTERGPEGIAEGGLPGACWLFRNLGVKQRSELIEQMLGDGEIFEIKTKPEGRGRPSKRLVAAKFVRKGDDDAR